MGQQRANEQYHTCVLTWHYNSCAMLVKVAFVTCRVQHQLSSNNMLSCHVVIATRFVCVDCEHCMPH